LHVAPKGSIKISRDKKDDIFLDCSVEGKADYLITGDKDLLDIGHYQGINIVTSGTFVKMVL
jgi:predicted nucleic acid-binding protein